LRPGDNKEEKIKLLMRKWIRDNARRRKNPRMQEWVSEVIEPFHRGGGEGKGGTGRVNCPGVGRRFGRAPMMN